MFYYSYKVDRHVLYMLFFWELVTHASVANPTELVSNENAV